MRFSKTATVTSFMNDSRIVKQHAGDEQVRVSTSSWYIQEQHISLQRVFAMRPNWLQTLSRFMILSFTLSRSMNLRDIIRADSTRAIARRSKCPSSGGCKSCTLNPIWFSSYSSASNEASSSSDILFLARSLLSALVKTGEVEAAESGASKLTRRACTARPKCGAIENPPTTTVEM